MAAPVTPAILARRIAQGGGGAPADLVLRGARLLDLVTGDLVPTDIAVCGDTIVGTYGDYDGLRVIEAGGRIAVPGFIDAHLHVESSLITPHEFDRCVLPRGTTTAIWDPHEFANVVGRQAFDYALTAAETTVMDLRVQLSSCVPATDLETAGARIEAADLLPFMAHPKVLGLAEVMNFPGVVAGDAGMLAKLAAFPGRPLDGHAPLLSGKPLSAYAAAGIRTDHESTSAAEALEKLRRGLTILIREGSVSKDLAALVPLLTVATSPFLAFCTDDRNPLDIAQEGHLDHLIRAAIAAGAPPLAVYRAASLSAATTYGLTDRGMIAPGRRADIVLLDDLEACAVASVIAGGRLVEEAVFSGRPRIAPPGLDSVRAEPVDAATFRIAGSAGEVSVIGVRAGLILTEHLRRAVPARGGARHADAQADIAKVAVVARHGHNRNVGLGFVSGFGMRAGAIASSVGHDSHNLCVVGVDDADMALAVNRLIAMQGGFCVVSDGVVRAELALPVAGLVSERPFEAVRDALHPLRDAARGLGVVLPEPFLQVAFLPLPVIPHLKITDRGLVDVDRMALVTD